MRDYQDIQSDQLIWFSLQKTWVTQYSSEGDVVNMYGSRFSRNGKTSNIDNSTNIEEVMIMKRYEELTVYKKQSDDTLIRVLPEFPSRCLSISLREMEEDEKKAQQVHSNSQANLPTSLIKT